MQLEVRIRNFVIIQCAAVKTVNRFIKVPPQVESS
jgi:hypothetical protein